MKSILMNFVGIDNNIESMTNIYAKYGPLFQELERRYMDYWKEKGRKVRISSSAVIGNINIVKTDMVQKLQEMFDDSYEQCIINDGCPKYIYDELKGVWTVIAMGILMKDLGEKISELDSNNHLAIHFVCSTELAMYMAKENDKVGQSVVLESIMGVIRGFLMIHFGVDDLGDEYEDMTVWTASTGDQLNNFSRPIGQDTLVVDKIIEDDIPRYLN